MRGATRDHLLCGTRGTECDEPAQHCDVGPASTVCAGADNLRQVALGKTHGCALDTAGRVYCWGKNNHGQSGYEPGSVGTTDSVENASLHQELANVLSAEGATATQLALGSEFSCALGSNGRVYCWGRNNTGQLGRDLLPSALASDPNPAAVSGLTDAIAVYAGGTRACAVRAGTATLGSRIVCWGDGRYLGLGSSVATDCGRGLTCSATPIEVPEVIMAHRDLNAGSMSIGTHHTCAVDRLNTLFCWGLNTRGQVGVSPMMRERPPTSPFTTSVVSVSAGAEHTLVALSAPQFTSRWNITATSWYSGAIPPTRAGSATWS